MRILMLAQSLSPIVGGEERVVEDLSRSLSERGHELAIATMRQPGAEPQEDLGGVPIETLRSSTHRLPGLRGQQERRHAPPYPDPETVIDLARVLERHQPEVVHAHNWLVHSYLPLKRRNRAALVLTNHDYGLLCATKRLFRKGEPCSGPGPVKCVVCAARHYGPGRGPLAAVSTLSRGRSVRNAVDLFLPISAAVQRLCRLSPENSRVISDLLGGLPSRPALDDPRLEQLPKEPFVLFFGDITEDKGAWNLAAVYRALESPPPLVMIGRNYLPELVGIPRIHIFEPWPHDLAIEALRRSMFAVVPSIWPEPFGLVALEAAAAGKPVIASEIGGLTDIVVDGETGLLVPPGDRPAMRTALRRLTRDDDLRGRLGEAAAARAANFGPDVIVPQFESAYRFAIERREERADPG
jgi:glycosyltransferase involved in cell wall biosynthesis